MEANDFIERKNYFLNEFPSIKMASEKSYAIMGMIDSYSYGTISKVECINKIIFHLLKN